MLLFVYLLLVVFFKDKALRVAHKHSYLNYIVRFSLHLRDSLVGVLVKVSRYSFFCTETKHFQSILSSFNLFGSAWKLHQHLEMNWNLLPCFFCTAVNISMETINQKNGKSVKHEFCENQMSYEKANISPLNYGVWQTEYKRKRKFSMFDVTRTKFQS